MPMTDFQTFMLCTGSAGMGFVLGWTLYFANRGKAGNISVSDLAAIVGALAGGVILGFLKVTDDPNVNAGAVGAYGIGLFAGFMVYFLLYRSSLKSGDGGLALRSIQALTTEAELMRLGPTRAIPRSFSSRSMTAPNTVAKPIDDDRSIVLDRANDLLRDLGAAFEDAEGNNARQREIDAEIVRVENFIDEIARDQVISSMSSMEMKSFFELLKGETKKLNAEAAKLKNAAKKVSRVSDLFGATAMLIENLKSLIDDG